MMMAPSDSKHSPQHGRGYAQPAEYQHQDCRRQAHLCLLLSPVRDIAPSTMDSLVAQVLQLIDARRWGSDRFVLLPP